VSDLQNYQFEYRGFRFGAYTDFGLDSVEGIDSFSVRANATDLPRGHGQIPGSHYLQGNQLIFKIEVDKRTFADVEQGLDEIRQAFRVREEFDPNNDYILMQLPGKEQRIIRARPTEFPVVRSASPGAHIIKVSSIFEAHDPRTYSAEERSVLLNPYAGAGLSINFPVTQFPISWPTGEEVDGSETVAVNEGNSYAWPLIRLHGPNSGSVRRLILQNMTYGIRMSINTPLLPNQVLSADMDAVVTVNGVVPVTVDGDNRYHGWELPRAPFYLGPGSNVIRLTIEGDVEGVVGVVTWRDTYT
jgi:hypothetical protein